MNKQALVKSTLFVPLVIITVLLLNLFLLFAFQSNHNVMLPTRNYDAYEKLWKEVDTLESKGLPKSALEKVNAIYALANKSDNAPQIFKSLVYTLKYKQVLEEGEGEKALEAFETAISKSHFPTKNILQSAAAEMYWNYYQQNRWKFSERTQITGIENKGIETWDIPKIVNHVTELYKSSLENVDSLQQTSIEPFAAILEKGNMTTVYRPTLYDFLAHRALDFFMNEEAYVTQPAYKFNITGEEVFQPLEKFTALKIVTPDSVSGKFQALRMLQNLLAFHAKEHNTTALIDADLKRFQFLRANSVSELKDSLYLKGLLQLENRFAKDSSSGDVSYAIAQFYMESSNLYAPPLINDHRFDKKTAMSYCEKVISKFPNSIAAKNCNALREEILRKNISLTVEKVNLPAQPFRGLLEYQNVTNVYFRIIKDDEILLKESGKMDAEKQFSLLLQQPVLKSWSQSLSDPGDYQSHAAEIKIPEMPLGSYIILGSAAEDFSPANSGIMKAATTLSNIGYVSKRYKDHYSFYVVNRESGKPISKANAKILAQQYDQKNRTYQFNEIGDYTTDANGYFEIAPSTINQNFRVEFTAGDDRLMADDYFYLYRYTEEKQKTLRTIFFTDRAIYRPGQTIYFKGIVLENEDDKNSLQTKFKSTVEFHDVNGQKIQSLDLVTNDYGSFQGSFTAPTNGLNGEMEIRNSSGSVSVSVEEYKRPRFEVVFDTLKGSPRLNESVSVKGKAKSYAGANIDGATVTYRVVRQARFPVWYYGMKRGGYDRFSSEMEIANGTTATDANGAFQISFTAIPDLKIPAKEKPQFDYKVIVDVVDITGETHSAESIVSVGYVSLTIELSIPETVSKDSLQNFEISTKNLNGIFEPANGTITVSALQQPDRIFRERLWKRPDQFVMTKDEYYKSFPNDVYDNENDFTSWSKKPAVVTQSFNTALSKIFSLPNSLAPGKYELEITGKDKYGEDVKVNKYFTVYAAKDKEIPLLQTWWMADVSPMATAGNTIPLQFGTSEKEMHVIYEIEAKNFSERKLLDFKKGKENLSLPITGNFKGGVNMNAITVKHGRVYSFNQQISVPYADKELKLEFETFRNKLLPGQNEEWKLKISGSKGEAVAAEMVAALYDASLDAFRPHNWMFDIESIFYPFSNWDQGNCFGIINTDLFAPAWLGYGSYFSPIYDQLNWFGFSIGYGGRVRSEMLYAAPMVEKNVAADGMMKTRTGNNLQKADSTTLSNATPKKQVQEEVSARKNLQETAFFFPQLQTDASGNVIFKFIIPEALTRWKFLGFAHTTDLKYGMITKETITQKDLMVTPNAPRFFREGDQLFFTAKVTNLSDHDLNGRVTLQLFDALTMKPIDATFGNTNNDQSFTVVKNQSSALSWSLTVPEGIEAVSYKVIAKAGNQSDGEENALPVLSNKTLVTESLPLNIRGNTTKNYSFTKLLQSGNSSTLKNHNLTLEVTSNPAWYAVQALPYLMEYPYQCSEQTFNRFYANSLAAGIAISNPRIRQVFDQWSNLNTDALLSNLEKNQELKSLLLQETPWVLQSQDETERKKRIALLFDLNRMRNEMDAAVMRLQQLQSSNGGWSWFAGGPDDRYITQYIVTGIGHLTYLKLSPVDERINSMTTTAIPYLDNRIREDYENLIRYKTKLDQNNLSYFTAQYLYARSYFNDIPVQPENKKAVEYYNAQAQRYWTSQSIYAQGMIALALYRMNDKKTPVAIIKSLKENSITNEELGMYWKNNNGGYYWYQAPIETQALLIEAFDEVADDAISVDNMKLWLLKQKQTNDWKTTKATAEAVYALLLRGSSWLMNEPEITVSLGNTIVDLGKQLTQAGTGYFETNWKENEITPQMGNIKVTRSSADNGVSWGAVYWQYFEQLDKITTSVNGTITPLSLQKKLFLQRNSATGPVMEPITTSTSLKPGDLVKVRIELRVDRDMEYVHMKDLRAACFEPINVLSGYQWQDGLGYYEETKDASTNFFFDHLSKGTYVFEYPLRVQLRGDFSNGITTIQCMYAPEFTSHSEGVRVVVK